MRTAAATTTTPGVAAPPSGAALAAASARIRAHDPSSLANAADARVLHVDLALTVDFASRRVAGSAALRVRCEADGVPELVLDTRDLAVASATWQPLGEGGTAAAAAVDVPFAVGAAVGALGAPLRVTLPEGLRGGAQGVVTLTYATSPASSACQWLAPEQTAGGKHPYLFTQCQAIHARALLPCQDSPAAKLSYAAVVTVPEPLTALMSAVPLSDGAALPASLAALVAADAALPHGAAAARAAAYAAAPTRTFAFAQAVPIAPYLIALAAGELASAELGPRSRVWSEPSMVSAGAFEFAETEAFLAAGEAIAGPYVWGRYDLLLLPPSFPYGGMENPCLTFVTPTLLAGDRSLANVVAHEIAHSWTGNLVTNAAWGDFWLNEGFTVFLERKILRARHGDATWHFHAAGGWMDLAEEVGRLGAEHPYTRLVHDLSDGADPDDAFSRVPYEKGFAFLVFLERAVGGPSAFEPFLRDYIARFQYGAISTSDFRAAFEGVFDPQRTCSVTAPNGTTSAIDWDTWLHAPGMPPVDLSAGYDTSLRDVADALARAWHFCDVLGVGTPARPPSASAADVAGWSSEQTVAFLERLLELRSRTPLSVAAVSALDELYALSPQRNAEVRAAWLRLRVAAGDDAALPDVRAFLTQQGRMKYLRPLYRALRRSGNKALRDAALAIFKDAKAGYHPIAAKMVAQDLGVGGAGEATLQ